MHGVATKYHAPVVVLVDAGTFSAADDLAAALRDDLPGVRFVGRPSGGGTGAPRETRLPRTCMRVTFATMRVWSPQRHWIEGAGIKPDVSVQWTRADVVLGRDPDLRAAVELLEDRG